MIMRRMVCATMVAGLLILGACSGGSAGSPTAAPTKAPTAAEVLSASATAMSSVTSADFVLTVQGQLPAVTVHSAQGALTSAGDAQGSAKIVQFGQLIEVEFVLVDGQLYLKGVTGGFAQVPAALAGGVYDPSAILNPTKGVSKVLSSVSDPTITDSSSDTWLVSGTVPASVAAGVVPGISTDVKAMFTISKGSSELTAAGFSLDGADGKPATVKVELSNLNEPVTITPPG